jgi:hypothetical protein
MSAPRDPLWLVSVEGSDVGWIVSAPTARAASRAKMPAVGTIVCAWRLGSFPERFVRAGDTMQELADKPKYEVLR